MIGTEFIWGLLIKGSVVVGLAWLLSLALRRSSASSRHAVWLGALGALILLPLLGLLPNWNVSVERSRIVSPLLPPVGQSTMRAQVQVGPNAPKPKPGHGALGAAEVLLGVWTVGFLAASGWGLLGLARVRKLIQSGQEWTTTEGLSKNPLIRIPGLEVPATAGLIRPVILMPNEVTQWKSDRLQMVIGHESAHIRRGDWLWQGVGRVACAIHWFNPLVWIAASQLRAESEFASDDFVLGSGIDPTLYAQELLAIARRANHRLAGAVSMARTPVVESRLRAIVDGSRRRGSMSVRSLSVMVALAAALVIPIGLLHAVPGKKEVPKDPTDALKVVMDRYEGLSAFEATIVHHESSGLFPGDYEQSLNWTKPATFTLKVTKPAKGQSRTAGDFTSDGTNVTTVGGGYPNDPQPLNKDINISPGYEVSGGPIISWLIKSPQSEFFVHPPAGFKANLAWDKPMTWHGVNVLVIDMKYEGPGTESHGPDDTKLFLNERGDEFIGFEWTRQGMTGYLIYTEQKLTQ